MNLLGRVAALEASNRKLKLDRLIESTLRNSKLPNVATKLFKEKSKKKGVWKYKNTDEFKHAFDLFKEAYLAAEEAKGEEDGDDDVDPFVISSERRNRRESDAGENTDDDGSDFSDCTGDEGDDD